MIQGSTWTLFHWPFILYASLVSQGRDRLSSLPPLSLDRFCAFTRQLSVSRFMQTSLVMCLLLHFYLSLWNYLCKIFNFYKLTLRKHLLKRALHFIGTKANWNSSQLGISAIIFCVVVLLVCISEESLELVTFTRTSNPQRSKFQEPWTMFNPRSDPAFMTAVWFNFLQHCAQSSTFLLFWKFLKVRKTLAWIKIDIVWLWCNPAAVSWSFLFAVGAGSTYRWKGKLIYFGLITKPRPDEGRLAQSKSSRK